MDAWEMLVKVIVWCDCSWFGGVCLRRGGFNETDVDAGERLIHFCGNAMREVCYLVVNALEPGGGRPSA